MKNYLSIKSFVFILFLIFGFTTINSCSKDDDDDVITTPTNNDNKTYKFTISIDSSVDSSDYISFVIVGGSLDGNQKTFWKVNGTTQTNQAAVSLSKTDFTGGTTTYVVESVTPFSLATAGIQLINFDTDLKYSFKAEVNGKVVVDETNKTLSGSGTDFTKDYDF